MNYLKTYYKIINKRRQIPISKDKQYCEQHHIIPISENGTNDSINLINLTAREHYICHLLLAKIYDDEKMWSAVIMMHTNNKNHQRNFRFNSRLYEIARIKLSNKLRGKKLTDEHKRKLSESHKGKKHTLEQKQKISKSLIGRKAWNKGLHHTEETKIKISNSEKGKLPWNTGKSLSKQHKSAISKGNKGKKVSDETKLKISESQKRTFILGTRKIPKNNTTTKGMKWFNNGIKSVLANSCPDGFKPGRIYRKRLEHPF